MKRLYLLAAAVSVTGGMAFSAPQEDAPEKEAAVLDVQTPPSGKQDQPAIPERLLDDSHMNEELGINEFTAPSIRKIFEDLEGLPEIPEKVALRARPERPPMDRCSLALQLGGMMADGFVIVQCGKMNEVKPIALDLSSYAKAIGAGERVNRHAASLLKDTKADVRVVFLPPWRERPDGVVETYLGWGEVEPELFGHFLSREEPVPPLALGAMAHRWEVLQKENAPLRAVVNGQVRSVGEDFYDDLIRRHIPEGQTKIANIIGNVLGQERPGIGDVWLAERIRWMLSTGELRMVREDKEMFYSSVVEKA